MPDWLQRLAHAPDPVMYIVAGLAAVAFWIGLSGLRRVRHVEDVPTARVRSAAQGYVELVGTAHMLDGDPIVSPLSHTPCCWYRYRVEQRRGERNWQTVQSGISDSIFVLRDATGDCIVDPEGAEVTSSHSRSWSDDGVGRGAHGVHARLPSLGRGADLVVNVGGKILETLGGAVGEYRYHESVILDGDPLYAIGEFRSVGPGSHGTTLRDLTGAILREWKQRPDELVARFDADGDGRVDQYEWERAREEAARQAAAEHAEDLKADHLHTLRKPRDGRFFLLSNLEEFDLLRRFRWKARLGFAGFALLAGVALLMLSTRT